MRIQTIWLLSASCLLQGAALAAEPLPAPVPLVQAALEPQPVLLTVKPAMVGITEAVIAAFGELDFVRPLTTIEAGRNDSNPVWSLDGKLIAFERSRGDKREVVVSRPDGSQVQRIYFQLSEENNDTPVDPKAAKAPALLIPGFAEDPSFNTGVSWGRDGKRLVFMSNGGEGNYDLYSQELGGGVQRLTNHKEKDGLAQWSPVADQIVFISGRTGKGDAYLLEPKTRTLLQLTRGDKPYLYPRWSPDGKKIALFYGSSENHDIYIMDNPKKPLESLRALTSWSYDDLRPTWSPDGQKIAFYTNYNESGDSKTWSLVVVAADGSDGISGTNLIKHIVATDVMPDMEQGPAWLPDSQGLVYVKDEKLEFNPIYLVDLKNKTSVQLKTGTKMNHDVASGPDGVIAFRAQVDQWDQIFLAKLKK
jgi:Tol biopolymer transport system component